MPIKKKKQTTDHPVITHQRKGRTFPEYCADLMTEFMGSWTFIIVFFLFLLAWAGVNMMAWAFRWDPYPFILLNLVLSMISALQAPIILMSQNRQGDKDRAVARNDYEVNLKSELEIADLHRKMDMLTGMLELQSKLVNALVTARRQEVSATMQVIEARNTDNNVPNNHTVSKDGSLP